MIDSKTLASLTVSNRTDTEYTSVMTLDSCENIVRQRISTAIDEELKAHPDTVIRKVFTAVTRQAIEKYIRESQPLVEGFLEDDGTPQLRKLQENLIHNFTGYGPIQEAMDSPTVTEIQINDYDSIFIEEKGKLRRYTRSIKVGSMEQIVPVSFGSREKYAQWVNRILMEDNKKLTEQIAVVDAITANGIRVNVVSDRATVSDKYGTRKYSPINVTLRKQPEYKFTTEALIQNKTMSTGIARLLELIPNSKLSTFVIGATGSGKTVLVNIITDNIPDETRVFAVGNPAELRLRRRDPQTGMLLNNIIHTQATTWVGDLKQCPKEFPDTLNLIGAAMRVTPEIAIMEEMRFFTEFERFSSLATSGHCVISTFHGKSAKAAIDRYLAELQSANPALTRETICSTLAGFLKFIIVQQKMRDGSRKIKEIAEVTGATVDDVGNKTLKLNYLYKFIQDKPTEEDAASKKDANYLKRPVKGSHYRVGCISEDAEEAFLAAGFTEDDYGFLTKPLEVDENGKPIPEKDIYEFNPILNFLSV